jgi:hypothetical protein
MRVTNKRCCRAIGSFHWPIDEYRPEEVLGQSLEALDPIRMAQSCHIVRADDGRPILQTMGDVRNVRHALMALKTTCFQIAARSIDPVRLYLLRWPSGARGSHVFLENYQHPRVACPTTTIQEDSSKSPRTEGLRTCPADIEEAGVSSSLSIERARSTIESSLRQITCLQGSIQLRARLGMFVLTRYKGFQDQDDMYELPEYELMSSQSQFKARTTEE